MKKLFNVLAILLVAVLILVVVWQAFGKAFIQYQRDVENIEILEKAVERRGLDNVRWQCLGYFDFAGPVPDIGKSGQEVKMENFLMAAIILGYEVDIGDGYYFDRKLKNFVPSKYTAVFIQSREPRQELYDQIFTKAQSLEKDGQKKNIDPIPGPSMDV